MRRVIAFGLRAFAVVSRIWIEGASFVVGVVSAILDLSGWAVPRLGPEEFRWTAYISLAILIARLGLVNLRQHQRLRRLEAGWRPRGRARVGKYHAKDNQGGKLGFVLVDLARREEYRDVAPAVEDPCSVDIWVQPIPSGVPVSFSGFAVLRDGSRALTFRLSEDDKPLSIPFLFSSPHDIRVVDYFATGHLEPAEKYIVRVMVSTGKHLLGDAWYTVARVEDVVHLEASAEGNPGG